MREKYIWLVMVTIMLFFGLASSVLADSLDNWNWRNPLPQGNNIHSVTFGNNTFVEVGEYGEGGEIWIITKRGKGHFVSAVCF